MEQKGRGRARGKPRSQEPYSVRPGPSLSQPSTSQHPQPSAWGAPRPPAQARAPAPNIRPMQAGRASYRTGGGDGSTPMDVEPVTAGGRVYGQGDGGASQASRGALRGGRVLENIILTKPKTCNSKKGSNGQKINLSANYFNLIHAAQWSLYQYHVVMEPQDDRTKEKKGMFSTAVKDIVSGFIFDGTTMYSPVRLPQKETEVFAKDDAEVVTKINIKLVSEVTPFDYHYLQVFNILIRKCMSHLKLQLVQRNYYDAKAKIALPEHHIELWPGYITSIRQHERDVLMCCEISTKVMRNDTVLQLLMECSRESRENCKRLFTERVIGTTIITDYNNRAYRIDDVDWDSTPESTFQKKDGTQYSYMAYYRDKYKVNIQNRTQPMIVSRAKAREIRAGMSELVYLVPELCRLTGLTDEQRANFRFMQDFAKYTRLGPKERIDKLEGFSKRLLENPKAVTELRNWDFQLSNSLVTFAGRVLPSEFLYGANKQKYNAGPQADWSRNVRSTKQFHSPDLKAWIIVCLNRNRNSAQRFADMISRAANGMNWNVSRPKICEIREDKPGVYVNELQQIYDRYHPELIMCVVSNNKQDRYASIKKLCCLDKPVPTQVIQARNLDSKSAMSIATKVAIQMNCKVGGAPWYIEVPTQSSIMIVGYDACHDPRQKSKSYGAVVTTYTNTYSHYFGTYTAHSKGEELSNDFALNIIKGCQVHKEKSGNYPQKIIIYRDGVGEGNIAHVRDYEVSHILKQLQKLYGGKPIELAFIVVTKRINTRLFADNANPPPGTVVDDVITLPEKYDFFLVSQCVRQGTVTPTNYNVIYDTTGFTPDHIQRLTYKLCHMYFNWAGTVRVPAPCQYAHKLAFLASQCLQRSPHPQLERLLYYL